MRTPSQIYETNLPSKFESNGEPRKVRYPYFTSLACNLNIPVRASKKVEFISGRGPHATFMHVEYLLQLGVNRSSITLFELNKLQYTSQ